MAPAMRLATSALRSSLRAPSLVYRNAAFNAARCYSSKSQVRPLSAPNHRPTIRHVQLTM
jgi:hypothetical protein